MCVTPWQVKQYLDLEKFLWKPCMSNYFSRSLRWVRRPFNIHQGKRLITISQAQNILQLPIWWTSQGRTAGCKYGALWLLPESLLCLNCSLLLPDVTGEHRHYDRPLSQKPPGHYPFPDLDTLLKGNLLSTWLLVWPQPVSFIDCSIGPAVNSHFLHHFLHVLYIWVCK